MQQLGHSVNVLIPEDVCQEVTLQALKAPLPSPSQLRSTVRTS